MLGRILGAIFLTPFDAMNSALEVGINGLVSHLPG